MVKQLQQWFSLHDMGEEGQITVEAAQMPGTMGNDLGKYMANIWLPARTAQGGGGSFKDRKPIGEVGGCAAWMA